MLVIWPSSWRVAQNQRIIFHVSLLYFFYPSFVVILRSSLVLVQSSLRLETHFCTRKRHLLSVPWQCLRWNTGAWSSPKHFFLNLDIRIQWRFWGLGDPHGHNLRVRSLSFSVRVGELLKCSASFSVAQGSSEMFSRNWCFVVRWSLANEIRYPVTQWSSSLMQDWISYILEGELLTSSRTLEQCQGCDSPQLQILWF